MKRLVLIDGNNLIYRSYYATAYTGNIMKNSKGFPTNALYGFVGMINKIIREEKPEYICVAFDKGVNFRKKEYSFYKEGREATPNELKEQMPLARDILAASGIKYLELEPYEADDIIGTLAKMSEIDSDFNATIISSDKDLLQLIDKGTDIKLLKKDSYIRYDLKSFTDEYNITPEKIVDLKALMGDASDNIPGVKGIGEKTALKLLIEHKSLEGVYENIENIKGATQTKLINDKENAFISQKIATIYKDIELDITLDDLVYTGPNENLKGIYEELEFHNFIKKLDVKEESTEYIYEEVDTIPNLENDVALFIELDNENYHKAGVLKVAVTDKNKTYVLNNDLLPELVKILRDKNVYTYDIKKYLDFMENIFTDDLMISEFLLGKNTKDDISSIIEFIPTEITLESLKKNKYPNDLLVKSVAYKSHFIYKQMLKSVIDLKENNLHDLYRKIELPLVKVLSDMEKTGILYDDTKITDLKLKVELAIDEVSKEIHKLAGEEFNISSPKQLGEILFEKLELKGGKKNKTGYKTDVKVLEKLQGKHPIIDEILIYRNLTKLNSTYIEGLKNACIGNKCHPIFKQTLARTGRLSCTEPNLQNIPVRDNLGKQIRKAFVPTNDLFLSADYSQIELRILAHIANDEKLINAFINNIDIHQSVAADIYEKDIDEVTKEERKTAKAVIFGIVYGISGFGLGENLNITRKQATEFIEKYYLLYPNVKNYMDQIIIDTKQSGYVTTLFNRKRVIAEINDSNFLVKQLGERMALNTPVQGTSADIIKLAMINIYDELTKRNLKSKLVLQVHDELIFDIVKEEEELIKTIVKDKMENVIKLKVPLEVHMSTGFNWYEV